MLRSSDRHRITVIVPNPIETNPDDLATAFAAA
jgi:hypothetical protein